MLDYTAVDLFCGCGGMTEGLRQAGFNVIAGIELDDNAALAYEMNHKDTSYLFHDDIRNVSTNDIVKLLKGGPLHLLAACPPCQGFSSMRRKNKKGAISDPRNKLIHEFYRFVEELRPVTIMLENVPALIEYDDFKQVARKLKRLGYEIDYKVVNVAKYGVPQRRKRLVMLGSLIGSVQIKPGKSHLVTVRTTIQNLEDPVTTSDPVHRIYPKHTDKVQRQIELTPHDGGSRSDLPDEYTLECHKQPGIGFKDVYGRLRWDDVSSTITGGCLNPSKGRFLHPKENRTITAREAALLQTFPINYMFPMNISRGALALMIGNALPPEFCKQQALCIKEHLDGIFMPNLSSEEKRSQIMRTARYKGAKPALFVRELLCKLGYNRYRFSTSDLNCSPDIVYPILKRAIFINGCFWHGHDCPWGSLPLRNYEFWQEKIANNRIRDSDTYDELQLKGWRYLVIWQCEFEKKNVDALKERLLSFMN
jgi:DNA (cytosine-5)-methyltransferase 1